MRAFTLLSLVASMLRSVSGNNRTVAPPGAIVIDQTGGIHGSFKTVQAGVDTLDFNSTTPQYIFIAPGTYEEQVFVPPVLSNLTIQGYTEDARTYEHNKAIITYNMALLNTTHNDLAASFRLHHNSTRVYNLIIKNTFQHVNVGGQNVASSTNATLVGYYATQFWGYQDTVLASVGVQIYAKCLIVGAIDFIYGTKGRLWIEKTDIRTIGSGHITASGRPDEETPSWYVINNSNIDKLNTKTIRHKNWLGRPWKEYARVIFQNSYLGDNIKPEGWAIWNDNKPNTAHVYFGEYNNTGPGSAGTALHPRANFSTQMTAPIDINTVLSTNYTHEWYYDPSYF